MTDDDTTEATERGRGLAGLSDTAIACRLRAAGFIQGSMFDAWMRRRDGEPLRSIAENGPVNPFTGKTYHWTAIEDWIDRVSLLIAEARECNVPLERDPSLWGIWIAEGHIVRLAANNTPKLSMRREQDRAPGSHFPDAQRLKASGKKPR